MVHTAMLVNIHTHRPQPTERTIRTAGLHPWHAEGVVSAEVAAAAGSVDAIGETGLDYACKSGREEQERLFREQLRIAEQHRLPVVIHCVRAFEPTMKILAGYSLPAVIFHGFMGSQQQMRRAVARGYFLSYGWRTFVSKRAVEALRATPDENLFFETDDTPIPIEAVYAQASTVRGSTIERLGEVTARNYERIFG